jgi:hypothetical protein
MPLFRNFQVAINLKRITQLFQNWIHPDPSMCHRLFQSFYNQLVSILSSVELFEGVLLDDYEVHPFEDPNGVPNKALFHLLLTYADMHFRQLYRGRKSTGLAIKWS